jgi:hypothetical protein
MGTRREDRVTDCARCRVRGEAAHIGYTAEYMYWFCRKCGYQNKIPENKMKEEYPKKDYLRREEVYEGLRKIGRECPDTKRALKN